MSVSATDLDTALTKLAVNMGRLDQIVNGDVSLDVPVDSGLVPSYAKLANFLQSLAPMYSRGVALVSAAYSVTGSDNAKTLCITGGNSAEITVGAASSYSNPFAIRIVNGGSTGSMNVNVTGLGRSWCYPGQIIELLNIAGTWLAIGWQARYRVSSTTTLYVDQASSAANDNGDGFSYARPFATIGAAMAACHSRFDHNVRSPKVMVKAGGVYKESVQWSCPLVGYNIPFLQGDGGQFTWRPADDKNYCLLLSDGAILEYGNVAWDSNGRSGITFVFMHQDSIVDQNDGVTFGPCPGGSWYSSDHGGGSININSGFTVAGSVAVGFSISSGYSFTMQGGITVNITGGYGFTYFLQVVGNANASLGPGINFTGSGAGAGSPGAKYLVAGNASCSLSSNTLPGNIAGSVTTGGIVY